MNFKLNLKQNGVDSTSLSHREEQYAFKQPTTARIWFG